MNTFTITFNQHMRMFRRNPLAATIVLVICSIILVFNRGHHNLVHGIGYMAAVWLACFVTDLFVNLNPKPAIGFPIKKSVVTESATIIICTLLGFAGVAIRFYSHWQQLSNQTRLAVLPLFLFVFPVVLALIYLFAFKYKPRELGLNLRYWYLPIFIHIIIGSATLWIAPESSHWIAALKEMNIFEFLFTGLISAALCEEFMRMLMQTRFAALFNNTSLGFVLATIIWALMHVPNFGRDFRTDGVWPGLLGAINIMPVGFLWGYITHRTKSLIPAVFVHGLNLWGLQNF